MLMRISFVIAVLLVAFQSSSQRLIFDNMSVNSGLPASEVYNLLQDHNGYIWAFTEYGIVKHNGSGFVRVCKNLPLTESEVYGVCEGPTGDIFILNSNSRIYCIRNDKAYKLNGIERFSEELRKSGSYGYNLYIDRDNTLHCSSLEFWAELKPSRYTIEGLPKLNANKINRHFTQQEFPVKFLKKEGQSTSVVNVIQLFPKDIFLKRDITIRNTGYKYNVYTCRLNMRNHNGKKILCTGKLVLVKERNGIVNRRELPQEVIAMEIDHRGSIWVGLRSGGLLELNSKLETVNSYFGTTIISDILFDDQGGLWVSTIGKGLYHCKNVHLRSYNYIPELKEGISLIKTENNELFVGTKEGSLLVRRNGRFVPVHFNLETYTISDICYAYNTYFVTSHIGFWKVDAKTLKSSRILRPDPMTPSYAIKPLQNGQLLAVTSRTLGIVDIKKGSLVSITKAVFKNRFLVEREKGEFFTWGSCGIMRTYNLKRTFPDYLKPLRKFRVTRIRIDKSKNIWFCTKENAVFCLDRENRLKAFKQLPEPVINDITFTSNGVVLLSTHQGAYACSVNEFYNNGKWKLVFPGEVMEIFQDKKVLLIGGKNGLAEMDVDGIDLRRNYHFFLDHVSTDSKPLPVNGRIEIQPQNNGISLSYHLLKYNSKQPILYYKLKGPIEISGSAVGMTVQFQNLQPGEYRLEVYPELKFEGEKSKLRDVRIIIVHPAFWETNTFYILLILLSGSLFAFIFWLFMRARSKRKRSREHMERMLTEYRLTALKAQINPHFMSNSLVAIQNLILQDETDSANLYIAKFSLLLRSLLDYSNRSAAPLKSELAMIELYVELEQLRFSNKFEFEIEVCPEVDLYDTYIPTLITQPFIENAIWHGLLPLSDHTSAKLKLRVHVANGALIISIEDNGVGRAYHRENNTERKSKGTDLIVSRIKTLNQLYETTGGRIEITDLKDENGQALGTLVTITLPASILNELYEDKEI